MDVSRRSFLKGGAFALAGVAGSAGALSLAGCAPKGTPKSKASEGASASSDAPTWLGTEPEISDVVKTINTEVLVVGAGTAGVFAACSAVENGAQTILIEKADEKSVGNGIRDTIAALNSKQQQADGENPNKFDVLNEMTRQSNGYGDDRLYHVWADNSGEAIDWYTERLEEAGVKFLHEIDSHEVTLRYPSYEVGHSIQWEGREYSMVFSAGILLDYAQAKGLEVHHSTEMIKLKKEGNRVVGLYAKTADGTVEYAASKGVIVCSGGYAHNEDMLKALQPETIKLIGVNYAFPSCTGDGIKACLWAGAQMDATHSAMIFDRAGIPADATDASQGELFWMGSQPFLKVDLNGKRFTNESGPYDYVLHDSFNLPYQTYCTLWDANYADQIKQFETHGCSRLYPHANGTEPVMPLEYIDEMNAELEQKGYIVTADTIEDLASKLGIPADELTSTVKRYNELCAKGEDTDYGKEKHRLMPLDTPPFKGIRQHGGYFIATMDGIKIDTQMRVLDTEGAIIEGLYCAGDCSGGYFGSSYVNLLSGDAAGRSVTFGRLAGKYAAQA